MAKIRIVGDSSGYVELSAPNAAGNNTLELPSNATKLVGADANNSLSVSGITTFSSGIVVSSGSTSAPSISPSGDSNTGIFFPAADTVAIGEGGTEVLRVDSSGFVGIGITNPSSILNIGSKTLSTNTDNQIILSGRQTATPGSFASFYFKNSADSGGSSASIRAIRNGDNYGTELAFFTQNSGGSPGDGSERIRIGRSGNIGIGNTNPSALLEVGVNGIGGNTFRTTAGSFNQDFQRTILDNRGIGDGSTGGYLLLIPAYPGSGLVSGKKFYGTIIADRGNEGSGNSTNVAYVHASTAYNSDVFLLQVDRANDYFSAASKVTVGGTAYLALRFGATGGGPNFGIYINGYHRGVDSDSNFLRLVLDSEVSSVTTNYGTRTVRF